MADVGAAASLLSGAEAWASLAGFDLLLKESFRMSPKFAGGVALSKEAMTRLSKEGHKASLASRALSSELQGDSHCIAKTIRDTLAFSLAKVAPLCYCTTDHRTTGPGAGTVIFAWPTLA